MATTRPCMLCVYDCACVRETACGIGGELCRFIWFISVYIVRQPFNWSVITSVSLCVCVCVCECVSWFLSESVCYICSCCGICIVPQTTTTITWMVRKKRLHSSKKKNNLPAETQQFHLEVNSAVIENQSERAYLVEDSSSSLLICWLFTLSLARRPLLPSSVPSRSYRQREGQLKVRIMVARNSAYVLHQL